MTRGAEANASNEINTAVRIRGFCEKIDVIGMSQAAMKKGMIVSPRVHVKHS